MPMSRGDRRFQKGTFATQIINDCYNLEDAPWGNSQVWTLSSLYILTYFAYFAKTEDRNTKIRSCKVKLPISGSRIFGSQYKSNNPTFVCHMLTIIAPNRLRKDSMQRKGGDRIIKLVSNIVYLMESLMGGVYAIYAKIELRALICWVSAWFSTGESTLRVSHILCSNCWVLDR
jgi:hypothetical protein